MLNLIDVTWNNIVNMDSNGLISDVKFFIKDKVYWDSPDIIAIYAANYNYVFGDENIDLVVVVKRRDTSFIDKMYRRDTISYYSIHFIDTKLILHENFDINCLKKIVLFKSLEYPDFTIEYSKRLLEAQLRIDGANYA